CLTQRDPFVPRYGVDPVEGRSHHVGELEPDLVAIPEEPSEVLHPLEVGDGDAAGVREDVWHDRNPLLAEDLVRLDRRRSVRALYDEQRVDPVRVRARELVLAGGEN